MRRLKLQNSAGKTAEQRLGMMPFLCGSLFLFNGETVIILGSSFTSYCCLYLVFVQVVVFFEVVQAPDPVQNKMGP